MNELFWVAIYNVDRAYGGPEEGGWWYDTAERVDDADLYESIGLYPQAFSTEEDAYNFYDKMQEAIDSKELNKGRREISSVLSDGRFEAKVTSGLPQYLPERIPHYE